MQEQYYIPYASQEYLTNKLVHDNQEKQVYGCIVDVIIPTNLVYVLFDPAIPTSSFNFIQLFLYLYIIILFIIMEF